MRPLLVCSALFFAAAALAERPPDMSVTPAERDALIAKAADLIEREYVDPEKGRAIAAALRGANLDGITTALTLVPAVNRVLKPFADAHLRFGYDHEKEQPEDREADRRAVARNAYGVHGVQRLDGNIGLLTWAKFHEPMYAGEAVSAAMTILHDTDALLVDLRASDGGSPEMVTYLLTHFMAEGDPVLVHSIYHRPRNETRQFWTLPHVPARRYVNKPVYILTSAKTFSAGEGFAEHMRHAHGVASLQLVVRGSVDETVGRRRHTMRPGIALFKPAGAAHSNVYRDDTECLLIEVPEALALQDVVAERTGRAWAFNLLREIGSREPGWQLVVEGLTLEALGHLARERWRAERRPPWLDDVVGLARDDYTLSEIAGRIGRHASHIAREFRRHEGVTVGEYARRCRLELAARALRDTEDSIAAIALAARFCGQSHFTNAFRRVFGVAPGPGHPPARPSATVLPPTRAGMVCHPARDAVRLMLRHLRFRSALEIPVRTTGAPLEFRSNKRGAWLLEV